MHKRSILESCLKGSLVFGDKSLHPKETIQRAQGRFEAGSQPVLQKTQRVDKGRLGIPVYVSLYTPFAQKITGNHKQMGKGMTAWHAEASAIMELVERYSLFSFVNSLFDNAEPRSARQFEEIHAGNPAFSMVSLDELLFSIHYQPVTYRERERLEGLLFSFPFVWTTAVSVSNADAVWLPFSWFWPLNEYNGSSAGNCLAEAGVQGLCEVVERHVCAVITREKLRTPTILLDSIADPDVLQLVERFRHRGINLMLKDFSLDTGISTVGAIAWDPSTFPERSEIVYTAGTATTPERAAVRAITEVAQLAGDFDTDGRYLESGLAKFATLEDAEYVLDSSTCVKISDLPCLSAVDFSAELVRLSGALSKKGFRTYLVDVTHPELALSAVYAVMPGNHFRDRTNGLHPAFHLCRIASGLRESQLEMGAIEMVGKIYPDRYEVAFYRGYCLEKRADYREAIAAFSHSLELGPERSELASIYCHRAGCYKEFAEYEKAVADLENAVEINPELKEVYNLMGFCLFKRKDHLKAIECFEKAIELDPGSAVDYANIAVNLRELGQITIAKRWYEMALELDPELDWARNQLEAICTKIYKVA